MTEQRSRTETAPAADKPQKTLTPAAERALAEAEARRQAYRKTEAQLPKEIGGRGGKEPGRYGDWEVKGLASDF
ncbi:MULTISPECIES: DUF1674 domain-containing protein [Mesorhizobium]|uniref:DUF1674 domain-containing protein n=1 Tax=Mesorhizobium shonense TaxID=1209948 RepID=A0ABV2I111_9HYPH|nr:MULTISPECIES: DUF1674 domain-containing protein [unclassified Mesorhizobium]AZO27095.1 DUF1674 domain-containing protein [Mesorhizobium sp. M1B.F.Ca.ET.045.04.1.1]RWB19214.1 MAG: DUF1674 domain-containing protein [Mesorhizobium sp.]RWD99718.1 MAG: DUF1674 domain-containing protein [Mesorhizobium sp.]TIS46397.1 MAG: DUF1674 domain-containing protein [Mesorhizobium sp.]